MLAHPIQVSTRLFIVVWLAALACSWPLVKGSAQRNEAVQWV